MTDETGTDPFAPDGAPLDPAVARATQAAVERVQLVNQMRGGGSWFFWIAGVSLVNAVVAMTGGEWGFLFSLTFTDMMTQAVNYLLEQGDLASEAAARWRMATGAVSLVAIAVFAGLGLTARKGAVWAFVVGLLLYGVDAALTLYVQTWLSLAFHAWALMGLFGGMQAARKLRALPAPAPAAMEFGRNEFEG